MILMNEGVTTCTYKNEIGCKWTQETSSVKFLPFFHADRAESFIFIFHKYDWKVRCHLSNKHLHPKDSVKSNRLKASYLHIIWHLKIFD